MNDRLLAWVRIGFGVLTIAAIVTQILNLLDTGVFNPTRFFLFFTILSNLFATAVFLEGGRRQTERSRCTAPPSWASPSPSPGWSPPWVLRSGRACASPDQALALRSGASDHAARSAMIATAR